MRNRDIEEPNAERRANTKAGADLTLEGVDDLGTPAVIFHGARIGIGIAEYAATGIDQRDSGTGGFGELSEPLLPRQHEGKSLRFFGELLTELLEESLLNSLSDKVVDRNECQGEN